MASTHIQALLQPPSSSASHKKTLDFINARYSSYEALEHDEDFDQFVEEERQRTAELGAKVRSFEHS